MNTAAIPLWEFVDVSKAYPGVLANDKVCIKLMDGSIHGLLGENGCGKSTLIKTLSGVQQPDSGKILLKGKEVQIADPQDARDKGVATVFQEFSIVPTLSVGENIFLGNMPRTRMRIIDWKKVYSDAAAVLAEMEVDIDPEAITGRLSVGEQQLVEIAKAIAIDARMIILDEPTAALGEDEIERLHQLLRKLREQGTAILYVSHRLDEVERIVDEVTILRSGRVVSASGETEINVNQIVSAMVGGDIAEHYPKEDNATDQVVLEARGLKTKNGVEDASFELHKGEVLGLGGVLGSGRTEIARALFGVDPLLAGELTLNGKPLRVRHEIDAINAHAVQGLVEMGFRLRVTGDRKPEIRRSVFQFPRQRQYHRGIVECDFALGCLEPESRRRRHAQADSRIGNFDPSRGEDGQFLVRRQPAKDRYCPMAFF